MNKRDKEELINELLFWRKFFGILLITLLAALTCSMGYRTLQYFGLF